MVRGCAFHPCTIDDPRGRVAVRASAVTAVRYACQGLAISARDYCALRAPTVVLARMKSASVPKPRLLTKARAQLRGNGMRERTRVELLFFVKPESQR
jgi:hypothetical protein